MPSIEELLNEAEMYMANEPVNDILEIDIETREIYIPDSEIILGVETDQKAERKYFRCPKIVGNNIDLSELELYVVFQNAGGELEENRDRYHVTDVETTEDGYITFSWELTAKVTEYMGNVQFGVCAIRTDSSGAKQNVWNTTIAVGKCLIGLSADMSEEEQQTASDMYTQLITELNSIATNRITEINTTADSRLEEYNDNATTKVKEITDKIQIAGNNQITYINNAGNTQTKNITDKGAEVLASIPTDYTDLVNRVETNETTIRTKAPAIVRSVTSESGEHVQVSGSADMPLQGMRIYGKSEQKTTTGKNLFGGKVFADKLVELGGSINETVKQVVIAPNIVQKKEVYLFADSSKQYTIMLNGISNVTSQESNLSVDYDDGTTEYCGKFVDKQIVFTTNAEKKPVKLRGAWWDGSATYNYEKVGVFEGVLTLSDFEPYTGGKPSPSPEYPQEIESVGGDGSIGVEIVSGEKSSNVSISTPNGLPAIPVPAGTAGITYTDVDGQAWIADEIDFKRGKYVQRVWRGEFDGSSDEIWSSEWRAGYYSTYFDNSHLVANINMLCSQYIYGNNVGGFFALNENNRLYVYFNYDGGVIGLDEFRALIAQNPIEVMTYLDTPIETDLTEAQLQAYKPLQTFKPTSIVSNDAGAQMEVDYALDTETYINGLNNECNSNLDKLNETLAENKKSDELTQRRLDALWKWNQGVVYEFQSDDTDGYQKDVPTGGRYVGLKQIGGKSLVWEQMVANPLFDELLKWVSVNSSWNANNGVAIANIAYEPNKMFVKFYQAVNTIKNHKYIASIKAKYGFTTGESDIYSQIMFSSHTGNYPGSIANIVSDGKTHKYSGIATATENVMYFGFATQMGKDTTINIELQNPQLFDLTQIFGSGNEPSTVAEFEALFPDDYYPYSAPEMVHAGVEIVESLGKNRFKSSGILTDAATITETGVKFKNTDVEGGATVLATKLSDILDAKIDDKITFSCDVVNGTGDLYLYGNDGCETYGDWNNGTEITITKDILNNGVNFYGDLNVECEYKNVMFRKSSTPTAYSPYTRNTLTIPESIRNLDGYGWSAGSVYNYVDFESKKFHKRVGCVDLGTLTWVYDSSIPRYYSTGFTNAKTPGSNNVIFNGLCKHYIAIDAASIYQNTVKYKCIALSKQNSINIINDTYTDADVFTTAMSGVMLYYELATEEVIDISDLLADLDEDAFVLPVETGGTLTFRNALGDGYRISIPNSEEYVIKLSEVASNE